MKYPLYMPVTLLLLMVMILSGCSNNIMGQRTYNKIQIGMALSDVEKIMGFDKNETLVCIDETKQGSFLGHEITHHDMQVNDKEKVARFSYITKDDPSVLNVVYSYSTEKERKSIIVKFDKTKRKVIAKAFEGL